MPVVAAALHSQVPAIAVAFKHAARPTLRLAYVMTDGAALPLALSDLVARARATGRSSTPPITCGHTFGGDYEAVSVYRALAVARHIAHADAAVVAMGPGIVGTDDPARVQRHRGRPGARRRDRARRRARSRACACRSPTRGSATVGVSHHSATALRLARPRAGAGARAVRRRPGGGAGSAPTSSAAGIDRRHDLDRRAAARTSSRSRPRSTCDVVSMGRPAADDPVLFEAAAAAGVVAAVRRDRVRVERRSGRVADRLERLVNLPATLLDTAARSRREEFVRARQPRYPRRQGEPAAAFERDKEILREHGRARSRSRPIGDGTEQGYRVRPDDYYLPDLGLIGRARRAALRVAVTAVASAATTPARALMKLGGVRRPTGCRRPTRPLAELESRPRSRRCSSRRRRAPVTVLVPRRARARSSRGASCSAGPLVRRRLRPRPRAPRACSASTASTATSRSARADSFEPPPASTSAPTTTSTRDLRRGPARRRARAGRAVRVADWVVEPARRGGGRATPAPTRSRRSGARPCRHDRRGHGHRRGRVPQLRARVPRARRGPRARPRAYAPS